jgi:hypothetical protein
MHRIIKKYQTPSTTLPSILEEGIPTEQEALYALLKEMRAKDVERNFGKLQDTSLLEQAANSAAYEDMINKQNAASIEKFSKSVDAQRSADGGSKGGGKDNGSFGSNAPNLSAISGISKAVGNAANIASSFIDIDDNSSFNQQQQVGNMLMSTGNPYLTAAGAV